MTAADYSGLKFIISQIVWSREMAEVLRTKIFLGQFAERKAKPRVISSEAILHQAWVSRPSPLSQNPDPKTNKQPSTDKRTDF